MKLETLPLFDQHVHACRHGTRHDGDHECACGYQWEAKAPHQPERPRWFHCPAVREVAI